MFIALNTEMIVLKAFQILLLAQDRFIIKTDPFLTIFTNSFFYIVVNPWTRAFGYTFVPMKIAIIFCLLNATIHFVLHVKQGESGTLIIYKCQQVNRKATRGMSTQPFTMRGRESHTFSVVSYTTSIKDPLYCFSFSQVEDVLRSPSTPYGQ